MAASVEMSWTLVQHSGFAYGDDHGFERAVEVHALTTKTQVKNVRAAGGVVYATYAEAAQAEDSENYGPSVRGLYPRVNGTFARAKLDGKAIYVPKTKVKSA